MNEHILSGFDKRLSDLSTFVIKMGDLALTQLDTCFHGLQSSSLEECREVIVEDESIDQRENKVDEMAMDILLRFHPVAGDLRVVLASINCSRALERVGDHCVNIARRTRRILKKGKSTGAKSIEPLYEQASLQLKMAIASYADQDLDKAMKIQEMDIVLDSLNKKLSKKLEAALEKQQDGKIEILHLLFVARSLERIGDLAKNIAEDVIFIKSAQNVRHSDDEEFLAIKQS